MHLSVKKTKNKIFYYGLTSKRVGKKIVSKTALKIGEHEELKAKGIDNPLQYAQDKIKEENKKLKENKLTISETIDFSKVLSGEDKESKSLLKNIGWFYLSNIYKEFKLDDLFNSIETKAQFNINDIFKYFVIDRILFPSSKKQSLENVNYYFGIPEIKSQDAYRCLDFIDKYSDEIQSYLYKNTSNIITLNTDVLYYDCTNFYFEVEEEDENIYNDDGDIIQWGLRRYGASKENRPLPIVQMGLFTDANGIPLSYVVEHGSNNEQNTVIPLELKLMKDYNLHKFIYCSDAGLASFDNRYFNTFQGRGYIVTQSLKKTQKEELDLIFKDLNWRYVDNDKPVSLEKFKKIILKQYKNEKLTEDEKEIISHDMIYKMYPVKRKIPLEFLKMNNLKRKVEMEETIFITFSIKYFLYQTGLFERQLENAKLMIEKKVDVNKKRATDSKRLIKSISLTDQGEVANERTNILNDEQINYEKKFHGFYAVATSENKTIKEILEINSSRWKIEQSFRILKSDFSARPVFVSTPQHIRAHFCICYTALLIYRILESKINEKDKENNLTTNQILQTLKNLNIIDEFDTYYKSVFTNSLTLKKLEKQFNISLDKQYYSQKKMKNLAQKNW